MSNAHNTRSRQRARAARQALRLCEAEVFTLTWGDVSLRQRTVLAHSWQPRMRTARAALLAAGLPPPIAAALRRRLQLFPDQEDQP